MSDPSWEEVADRLRAHSTTPGDLLQEALRIVREHPNSVAFNIQEAAEGYNAVVMVAVAALKEGLPDLAGIDDLLDKIHAAAGALLGSATVAHALAQGLDLALVDQLVTECEARGRHVLGDGDWFLKPTLNLYGRLRAQAGGHVPMGTRPAYRELLTSEPAQTRGTALYAQPAGITWSVSVNWRHSSELDAALSGAPTAAAVHPLTVDVEMAQPEIISGGAFGVGPANGEAAWLATLDALEQAHRDGVAVAVVPELVIGVDVNVDLTGRAVPALVVSGTQHVIDNGKRRNRLRLHLMAQEIVVHDKVVPFGLPGADASEREAIHPGEVIEVVRSAEWAVVPLTCADVNDTSLVHALERLHANLVLVASMTSAPGYFPEALRKVTGANQGMAVWVNQPPRPGLDVDTAAFYLPGKKQKESAYRDDLPNIRPTSWEWVR